jgi:very-short-patch-repair endonuclease
MTQAEQLLWKALRKHKLPFRRQAPIGPFIVDFAWHSARLIVELDGGIHRLADVAARDAVRAGWLERQGYRVIRFTNDEVLSDPEGAAGTVVVAARTPPSQPFPHRGGRA